MDIVSSSWRRARTSLRATRLQLFPRVANQRNHFSPPTRLRNQSFPAAFLPSPKFGTKLNIEFDTITLKLAKIQGSG
jgi:hypothetical protein